VAVRKAGNIFTCCTMVSLAEVYSSIPTALVGELES